MRAIFTSLAAIVISGVAGGLIAVIIADWTKAKEVFILVFMSIAPVTLLVAAVFLLRWSAAKGQPHVTDKTAMWMIAVVAALFAGFSAWSLADSYPLDTAWREVKLFIAFALTFWTIIAAQWLIFRRRAARARQKV